MISTLPPIKGISPYTLGLVSELNKNISIDFIGFKEIYPNFLYPGGTKYTNLSPTNLRNVKNRTILTWYNPFSWIYAGFTIKGNIVHAQWWSYVLAPIYITILSICRLRRKKIVLTIHNVNPHENKVLFNIFNKIILFFGDYFIVHSNQNKKVFRKTSHISTEKIFVIPHGLINSNQTKDINQEFARRKLGYQKKDKVILFFGIIRPYKGLDLLIEAFKKLDIIHKKLIIAGKCWEPVEKYRSLINNDRNIRFINNFIPDNEVELYFKSANLVILPYKKFDSSSGVGSLCLAYNKPLIVSEVGGLPDLVYKKDSCVFKPNSVKELIEKMDSFFKNNQIKTEIDNAIALQRKKFSWNRISRLTIEVYNELLNKREN